MSPRALMPDHLRLVALFGIVVVNVQFMAYPITLGFEAAPSATTLDDLAIWAVNGLALFKSYGLFSFMFGVGLAYQIRSAERRGLPFGRLYRNRMIGLALLGVMHGVLFFPGDILLLYALVGALLYRWRDWAVGRLVRTGAILLAVQVLVALPLVVLAPPIEPNLLELERAVMTGGTWAEVATYRAASFAITFPILLVIQGIAALGWFCLGLAAVRAGLIDDPRHPLWARARRLCLGPGLLLGLTGAALWQWGDGGLGEALTVLCAPIATLGYLGLIAAWPAGSGRLMRGLRNIGASSLSLYLGQSILLSTLFAPYGAGLWGTVGAAEATGIALAATLVLMLAVTLWRRVFGLGPFEWVLRRITRHGVARS